jgi:hypothetical protein
VKTRPGQHGRTLSYVDVSTVLQRLHEACDVVSFEVVRHEIFEHEVIVVGRLTADGVVNIDFGCAAITQDADGMAISVGDDLKAASSDCIKRCARLLGCPLDLQAQTERTQSPAARSETPQSDRITTRQLAAIESACRRRSINREQLHALVDKTTGKAAPQFLTRAEASAVLTQLDQLASAH